MAITSGFFNSVNGDRLYNAEEISHYFDGLISDGVFQNIGSKLAVTQNGGMSVKVGTGRAFVKSHWLKNDEPYVLSINTADTQLNRIDRVVIRLDLTESQRTVTFAVKTGAVAYSPVAPALTRTNTVYELCLAQIYVYANTTTIKQSNIVDYRPNSTMCGWVTGIIKQVDTADLFLQWQSAYEDYYSQMTTAFNTWFSDLTQQLRVDTTIKKYQNTVLTRTATNTVTIGIPEYETTDILFVYVSGTFLVENKDYTVSGSGENASITTIGGYSIEARKYITFIVLKSVIGLNLNGEQLVSPVYSVLSESQSEEVTVASATEGVIEK